LLSSYYKELNLKEDVELKKYLPVKYSGKTQHTEKYNTNTLKHAKRQNSSDKSFEVTYGQFRSQ
jgi:hypothetical protein